MAALRRTKILITLGPSTDGPGILPRLVGAGIDAVRLNMSHGTHEEHARRLRAVRRLAAKARRRVPIVLDLSGPKIRVGELPPEGIQLERGAAVRLVPGRGPLAPASSGQGPIDLPVPVPALLGEAKRGDAFLLKDGLIRVRVKRPARGAVLGEVEEGGLLRSRQGIALPGARLPLAAITTKDREDIRFGLEAGADFFAMSFVRSAADVRGAKRLVGSVPLLAKIERPEALDELGDIIDACAGVIVARGDLGVELVPERVPLLQKQILREANRRARIAILATQMLASMEESPIPTRAEATDVANAVLDGADGLLLTGETAGGKHPVAATQMLVRIVDEIESSAVYRDLPAPQLALGTGPEEALASAAVDAARSMQLEALVVLSRSGRTTALLSDRRPAVPIVALAADDGAARRLALQWGVLSAVRNARAARDATAAAALARQALGLRRHAWYGVLHAGRDGRSRHLTLAWA
ncbi:MAG: pyruvate kinase [Deltaproteobacteria bacterium]|nr:pyruvate kinase [Deltaproteobacteria bacterium]